jgi:hypothetical protein
MSVKKNIATTVALVAAFFAASINPASAQRMLGDRSAQAVEEARKDINDASILDIKDRYADIAVAFDGNVTTAGGGAIKVVAQDKADQGISLGAVVGGETFAGKFSPLGGVAGSYQFRRIRLGLEGYVSVGYPDELSDDQSKFVEFNGVGSVAVEVFRSKSLEHSFLVGAYGAFKAGKNSKYVDLGNGGYVWQKENAFNIGAGGSIGYIYSPKWSSIYHMVELRVGANHKLHTEGDVEKTSFAFGGNKAYFQASVSYKLMLGLGKRHSKAYNDALKNRGYSEQQMRSIGGLK